LSFDFLGNEGHSGLGPAEKTLFNTAHRNGFTSGGKASARRVSRDVNESGSLSRGAVGCQEPVDAPSRQA
jgi:hypothetical protein